MNDVLQLYPTPPRPLPLTGLYLAHDVRQFAENAGQPFVYTNYIASLDGRIAIPHPSQPGMVVPQAIANDRDWRLFQELAAQADVLLTSGRYLRDYAAGRAQEILRIYDDPRFSDLGEWRAARGLPAYPALAVISASLDFPIPPALAQRTLLVFTVQNASPDRMRDLARQAGRVIVAGETRVDGAQLVSALAEMNYRTIYNATGPKVLHLLLSAGALNRLYLTHASRALGGDRFASLVEGELLQPAPGFRLHALYFDADGLDGLGQLFASYDRA